MYHKKIKNSKLKKGKGFSLQTIGKFHTLSFQLSVAFFKKGLSFLKNKNYFSCIKALNNAIKYNPFEDLFVSFKVFIIAFLKVKDEIIFVPMLENIMEVKV